MRAVHHNKVPLLASTSREKSPKDTDTLDYTHQNDCFLHPIGVFIPSRSRRPSYNIICEWQAFLTSFVFSRDETTAMKI